MALVVRGSQRSVGDGSLNLLSWRMPLCGLSRPTVLDCFVALPYRPAKRRDDGTMTREMPPTLLAPLIGEPTPQASFPRVRKPWFDHMHDRPEVLAALEQLPDRVDRQIIRDVVASELDAGRVLSAFVSAMVWGCGSTSGRGALRTR